MFQVSPVSPSNVPSPVHTPIWLFTGVPTLDTSPPVVPLTTLPLESIPKLVTGVVPPTLLSVKVPSTVKPLTWFMVAVYAPLLSSVIVNVLLLSYEKPVTLTPKSVLITSCGVSLPLPNHT